ncbi:hypothetical protein PGT21_006360 [Puccinia graminis f. sp. tritici]|uniref:Uncharacterized protein n=1 Tax=Puccinia graminis f. sp. tritici TaxID=56615 RepID=A0A5B0N370_PUCGR|nr:hypothetical protein PGT21_006360 [Puccinia graminis f. sp. tritici]
MLVELDGSLPCSFKDLGSSLHISVIKSPNRRADSIGHGSLLKPEDVSTHAQYLITTILRPAQRVLRSQGQDPTELSTDEEFLPLDLSLITSVLTKWMDSRPIWTGKDRYGKPSFANKRDGNGLLISPSGWLSRTWNSPLHGSHFCCSRAP